MNEQMTMDWQQLDLTLAGLKQHYLDRDFTPRQLVEHLLSLERDDDHNIWIERLSLSQLTPYLDGLENVDSNSMPLFGVPFAIKDNIDLAGIDTTAACEAFRYTPENHASVVGRLIAAGAIPMGKTNMDQFATGLVGTRSPWGPGRNAFNPEYISGGSSSGSAVATAKGLVSFALGTDTAGSGRVPAMFNNLVGLKPTRGLISCTGVVPACQSLDCVSVFALTVDDANSVLAIAEGSDPNEPYSRANSFDNGPRHYGQALPCSDKEGLDRDSQIRIGIPRSQDLNFFGDDAARQLFQLACQQLTKTGFLIQDVDVSPLLEAAKLLYEGPWVAERYIATETVITQQPGAMLPVIREIIGKGDQPRAVDGFKALYKLQAYKQQADKLIAQFDALLMPTAPTCFTIAEVERDPIRLNSQLGTYTNFMNLLDLAAVAVPAGFLDSGVGFGVTLMGPAFSDRRLLSIANTFCQQQQLPLGALDRSLPDSHHDDRICRDHVDLVVCGAHLEGMPLNWQLTERSATLQKKIHSAAAYRLFAMADGRPAMVRDEQQGKQIQVEVWRIAKSELGSFVAAIPAPLGIGKVQLADGSWHCGFIAEPRAVEGAEEITHLGGWRAYKGACR